MCVCVRFAFLTGETLTVSVVPTKALEERGLCVDGLRDSVPETRIPHFFLLIVGLRGRTVGVSSKGTDPFRKTSHLFRSHHSSLPPSFSRTRE